MAAVARAGFCENRDRPMSKRLRVMTPPPAILLVPLVGAAGGGQFDTNIAASPAAASA
jgi:hypothetical protein